MVMDVRLGSMVPVDSMRMLYGGLLLLLQERIAAVQFVTPILENKVFNTRSNLVARLTAYGVLTTIDWPPTVKHNAKNEMKMCQSIVSKAKETKPGNGRKGVSRQLAPCSRSSNPLVGKLQTSR